MPNSMEHINNIATMTMRKTKETKGTVVFTEQVDEDSRPHTFYILREAYVEMGEPDTLNVTLEPLHTGEGTPDGEDV